ncbi:MAG: hypothetical protein LC749_17630 [Actinobacteria bacterium]|nr:hypothetical protein [Actinomycetota bacterium]
MILELVCQGDDDRGCVLEQNERDRCGDRAWLGAGGASGPGDGAGVRVSVQDPDQAVVGAGGVGLDPDGAGPGAEPGLQRGDLGDDVGGRLPPAQPDASAPAPHSWHAFDNLEFSSRRLSIYDAAGVGG